MGRLSTASRVRPYSAIPAIPDYDGNGWNPGRVVQRELIACWYPAWAAQGCQNAGGALSVVSLRDMGPWGQTLSATLNVNAPTLSNQSLLNGRAAFDTQTAGLSGDETSGAPTGTDKTVFVVFRGITGSNHWLFGKGATDATEEWILAALSGGLYYDSGNAINPWVQGGAWSNDVNYVFSGRNSGNTHVVRLNGTQTATRTGSGSVSNTSGQISVGTTRSGGGTSAAWVAEAISYRTALSDAQMLDVERRLGVYYGCAVV